MSSLNDTPKYLIVAPKVVKTFHMITVTSYTPPVDCKSRLQKTARNSHKKTTTTMKFKKNLKIVEI